jgi:hypothetical protein
MSFRAYMTPCQNADCQHTDAATTPITRYSVAGKQDWSRFDNGALCTYCYSVYYRTGSLTRPPRTPKTPKQRSTMRLVKSESHCTYSDCRTQGKQKGFLCIVADLKAGGHDWQCLADHVRCRACIARFLCSRSIVRIKRSANTTQVLSLASDQ